LFAVDPDQTPQNCNCFVTWDIILNIVSRAFGFEQFFFDNCKDEAPLQIAAWKENGSDSCVITQ